MERTRGKFFGQDRLVEFLERQTASGEPAPEILRRLSRTIIDYQDGAAAKALRACEIQIAGEATRRGWQAA